ncbi:nuclease-related domain-containing protein [Streptomyces sp. NPDC060001]|uniref:nuclease-related domain-containing protein n=1 Tax=Streptomyces sp. NPDC060001 TaxID=3347032 RepID=UPI003680B594
MTSVANSAARQAAQIRAHARRGLWRRATAAMGLNPDARRADARAALWAHGAQGEAATARLLAPLERAGWTIRHDLRLRGARWNVDTVLVSPCGTAVVVLDTKAWRKNWTTQLVRGRVHCRNQEAGEDRHEQVEKVAGYAQRIGRALELPGVQVLPLLVVHGSPVAGGCLAAQVQGVVGPVYVLSPSWLVSTMVRSAGAPDVRRAAAVTARVDRVLLPYRG